MSERRWCGAGLKSFLKIKFVQAVFDFVSKYTI